MTWKRQPSLSIQSSLFPSHPTISRVIKQCSLKRRQGRSAITANFTLNVPRSSSCCFWAGGITISTCSSTCTLGWHTTTPGTQVSASKEKFHQIQQKWWPGLYNSCTSTSKIVFHWSFHDMPLFSFPFVCAGGGHEKTGCRSMLPRWMTVILLLSFVITLEKGTDWVKHGMKKQTIYSSWQAADWLAQFWPMTNCL